MFSVPLLEQHIAECMHAVHVPGLAVAIVQQQEVLYSRGFGVTSVEEGGQPVTPQTLFRIGSMTKPLTGTAVMRLVEAGALDVDRPITAYLPWFALSETGMAERVTPRMLLSHMAGLPTDDEPFGHHDPEYLGTCVREAIPRYRLVAPPGTVFSYSNPGLSVLGHLAEAVTGTPFTDLMHDLVFAPLDMHRTTFEPTG